MWICYLVKKHSCENLTSTIRPYPSPKKVLLINSKKFVILALDADNKTFVVYVAIWEQEKIPVHSKKQAKVGALIFDKAFIVVLSKYFDYSNVFLL